MSLDVTKLENAVRKSDGKIIARCPACAAAGGDTKGEHLVVFPDGKYGCVAYPKYKAHNREILKLTGSTAKTPPPKFGIHRQIIPESRTIMSLGRLGQAKASPCGKSDVREAPGIIPLIPKEGVSGGGDESPSRPTIEEARALLSSKGVKEFMSRR